MTKCSDGVETWTHLNIYILFCSIALQRVLRETQMEPPPAQAIETSSNNFQAGEDEQDKVINEW